MFENIKVGDQVMVGLCALRTVERVTSKRFFTSGNVEDQHKKEDGSGVGSSPNAYPLTEENQRKIKAGIEFDGTQIKVRAIELKINELKTVLIDSAFSRVSKKSVLIRRGVSDERMDKFSNLNLKLKEVEQVLEDALMMAKEIM